MTALIRMSEMWHHGLQESDIGKHQQTGKVGKLFRVDGKMDGAKSEIILSEAPADK